MLKESILAFLQLKETIIHLKTLRSLIYWEQEIPKALLQTKAGRAHHKVQGKQAMQPQRRKGESTRKMHRKNCQVRKAKAKKRQKSRKQE